MVAGLCFPLLVFASSYIPPCLFFPFFPAIVLFFVSPSNLFLTTLCLLLYSLRIHIAADESIRVEAGGRRRGGAIAA